MTHGRDQDIYFEAECPVTTIRQRPPLGLGYEWRKPHLPRKSSYSYVLGPTLQK